MAQIPQITARQRLNADRVPNTELIPYEARAWSQVGASLEDVGSMLTERQQQRENFAAEDAYRSFKLRMADQLDQQKQNMPEGGVGFHDDFMSNVFRPSRDDFLKKIPERLQEKFGTLLGDDGSDATEWSLRAAASERDASYNWAKDRIGATQQDLANALSMNPEQYEEMLAAGNALIDSAPIPTLEKRQMRRDWENMAQVAHLNRLMEDDPELVLKALGANPNLLSPSSQFEILKSSVKWQESGGNKVAISNAGAVGEMQVMPGTARDIAEEIGDTAFPFDGDPNEVTAYLLRPGVSDRYGTYYLKKMMKMFPNDLEAALIGYHSGPGAAEKWVKAGRDDKVLGPVGRKYYKEVISRLPGGNDVGGRAAMGGAPVQGSAGNVRLLWIRDGSNEEMKPGNPEYDKLNPQLLDRVRVGFAGVGLDQVRIRSGHRDAEHNRRVKGAKGSQHIGGNAVDIDVTGLDTGQREKLIRSLSAAGITGLGVGANTIHADLGGRRAWGYNADGSHGGPIPKWATGAINDHLSGDAQVPLEGVRTVGRYSTLPYDQRQKFINGADAALTKRLTDQARGTAVERVALNNQMQDELARLRATGSMSETFDETVIQTTLGEDDYLKFVEKKQEAERTFTALQGMTFMSPAELSDRIELFEPDPAANDFASQQKVHAAVVKEAERVQRLRSQHPDKAALEYPEVKEAFDKVRAGIADGNPAPAEVRNFVELMIRKQKEFGVKADAVAPITSEWAFEIGRSLTRVPELSGKNLEDVRAAVAVQYASLQEYFGDLTDEVIIYALSEYHGVSETNAKLITAYMQSIAAGGDPFKPRRTDAEDVEGASDKGILDRIGSFLGFGGDDEPEAPSPEIIRRVMTRMEGVDDPAQEAVLVEQYGQAAVDAAKAQLGREN